MPYTLEQFRPVYEAALTIKEHGDSADYNQRRIIIAAIKNGLSYDENKDAESHIRSIFSDLTRPMVYLQYSDNSSLGKEAHKFLSLLAATLQEIRDRHSEYAMSLFFAILDYGSVYSFEYLYDYLKTNPIPANEKLDHEELKMVRNKKLGEIKLNNAIFLPEMNEVISLLTDGFEGEPVKPRLIDFGDLITYMQSSISNDPNLLKRWWGSIPRIHEFYKTLELLISFAEPDVLRTVVSEYGNKLRIIDSFKSSWLSASPEVVMKLTDAGFTRCKKQSKPVVTTLIRRSESGNPSAEIVYSFARDRLVKLVENGYKIDCFNSAKIATEDTPPESHAPRKTQSATVRILRYLGCCL
jgi:hypothetical protein